MKIRCRKRNIAIFLTGTLLAGCANSPSVLEPYGPDSARTAYMTWGMFAVAGIVVIVVSILLWMAFQRSRQDRSEANLYANDRTSLRNVVLGGGFAPLIVLLIMMGLGIGIENSINTLGKNGADNLEIEIIGHQWWWEVRYTNQVFDTANEIHIPAGQPVTLHVTTADVIHSFWVPELHGKIDLIPGQTNTFTLQADKVGTYRGQCAEFCGTQHAHMAFLIIADSPEDFAAWLKNQEQPGVEPEVGSLEQQGQQAFLGSACVYCHTIEGTNASGHVGPDLTHLSSRQTIASGTLPNNPGNLAGWTINSQTIKPGNHMPPMNLNGDQVQALLAYLATLK